LLPPPRLRLQGRATFPLVREHPPDPVTVVHLAPFSHGREDQIGDPLCIAMQASSFWVKLAEQC
jgi:hypothetical protein